MSGKNLSTAAAAATSEEESTPRKKYKPANIGSRLPPLLEAQLNQFWQIQLQEQIMLQGTGPNKVDFKTVADLPLSRIKRVMKADSDVAMVSAEAPVIFARACAMFILEITQRSWYESTSKDRRTVQKEDVYDSILKADVYDFLVDIVNGVLEQEREENRLRRSLEAAANAGSGEDGGGGSVGGGAGGEEEEEESGGS